jgi:hypothetical protein
LSPAGHSQLRHGAAVKPSRALIRARSGREEARAKTRQNWRLSRQRSEHFVARRDLF